MPEINVVAAPVVTGLAPASAATPVEGATANPFAAILQRQMVDPAGQTSLASKTDLAVSAATDALPEALNRLVPLLFGNVGLTATGNAGRIGHDATATDKNDPTNSEPTAIDMLLALPMTQTMAVANMIAGGAANAPPDLSRATNTEPMLPTLAASSAANLAAAPDVTAATAIAGQPVAKDSFEALLAATADSRAQALIASAHTVPAANNSPAPARIENSIGTTAWNTDVGDHMVWMANQGHSRAELVLTPPQLGRIEISLSMSGDQASAVFTAASPAVREALENAMPRLREILADAGVMLGQAQVGADTSGRSANGGENGDNSSQQGRAAAGFGGGTATAAIAAGATNPWLRSGRGMVDVFA